MPNMSSMEKVAGLILGSSMLTYGHTWKMDSQSADLRQTRKTALRSPGRELRSPRVQWSQGPCTTLMPV